jgi:hypothetical protein
VVPWGWRRSVVIALRVAVIRRSLLPASPLWCWSARGPAGLRHGCWPPRPQQAASTSLRGCSSWVGGFLRSPAWPGSAQSVPAAPGRGCVRWLPAAGGACFGRTAWRSRSWHSSPAFLHSGSGLSHLRRRCLVRRGCSQFRCLRSVDCCWPRARWVRRCRGALISALRWSHLGSGVRPPWSGPVDVMGRATLWDVPLHGLYPLQGTLSMTVVVASTLSSLAWAPLLAALVHRLGSVWPAVFAHAVPVSATQLVVVDDGARNVVIVVVVLNAVAIVGAAAWLVRSGPRWRQAPGTPVHELLEDPGGPAARRLPDIVTRTSVEGPTSAVTTIPATPTRRSRPGCGPGASAGATARGTSPCRGSGSAPPRSPSSSGRGRPEPPPRARVP